MERLTTAIHHLKLDADTARCENRVRQAARRLSDTRDKMRAEEASYRKAVEKSRALLSGVPDAGGHSSAVSSRHLFRARESFSRLHLLERTKLGLRTKAAVEQTDLQAQLEQLFLLTEKSKAAHQAHRAETIAVKRRQKGAEEDELAMLGALQASSSEGIKEQRPERLGQELSDEKMGLSSVASATACAPGDPPVTMRGVFGREFSSHELPYEAESPARADVPRHTDLQINRTGPDIVEMQLKTQRSSLSITVAPDALGTGVTVQVAGDARSLGREARREMEGQIRQRLRANGIGVSFLKGRSR